MKGQPGTKGKRTRSNFWHTEEKATIRRRIKRLGPDKDDFNIKKPKGQRKAEKERNSQRGVPSGP